jgi:hypothetical protein
VEEPLYNHVNLQKINYVRSRQASTDRGAEGSTGRRSRARKTDKAEGLGGARKREEVGQRTKKMAVTEGA